MDADKAAVSVCFALKMLIESKKIIAVAVAVVSKKRAGSFKRTAVEKKAKKTKKAKKVEQKKPAKKRVDKKAAKKPSHKP